LAPARFGVRIEDKDDWERRVPLTPDQVAAALQNPGVGFVVQPSPNRVFADEEYRQAGAEVSGDLSSADIILAIKEVPSKVLLPGKTYVYFAHVIKGQPHNMGMLQTLLDRGCTLIDYEKIEDAEGRRLIFFGNYAGLAGMYETIHAMGQRFHALGIESPFADQQRPVDCVDLASCARNLQQVGERISKEGLPPELVPLVIGFAGYGNVSKGAQSVIDDNLPVEEIQPEELETLAGRSDLSPHHLYKVVFEERHMVEPTEGQEFQLQEYYDHPERYRSTFERHLTHLDVLVNCIFWTERYPRLVTLDWCGERFAEGAGPKLKVIGDISCDVGGSIQCTVEATSLGDPVYTYDPITGNHSFGHQGRGLTILAVDNLPAALARESSAFFGDALSGFVPDLAAARWDGELHESGLPPELQRAVIVWRGKLTADFQYLKECLPAKGLD
jgi:alpha-aminoadipic semialdehyde synthase